MHAAARTAAASSAQGSILHADLGGRPHVAGAARQVDHGGAARDRRRRRRRRTCRRSTRPTAPPDRRVAVDARAHGGAPREPGVRVVPPGDRSARPRARELRRRRASGGSRTTACRSMRPACCTTARRSTARPACAQALLEHSDMFVRNVHREPDGLRARPPRRVLRPCRRSARSCATRRRTTTASRRSSSGIVNSPAFQMSERRTAAEPIATTGSRRLERA